uniref:NR LBD domain-containing protein n=1 Tax=Steinernema glaseri TaxID=37863 RepID=A0A1I8A2X6_9BILA
MNAVPFNFVDSVVGLLDHRSTLEPESKEGTKIIAKKRESTTFCDLATIRKNRRFARIDLITDSSNGNRPSEEDWEDARILGETEAAKQLASMIPQFEPSSHLCWHDGEKEIVFRSLMDKVTLREITLHSSGPMVILFLEKQIDNSPYLDNVYLHGERWPNSVLPLLIKLCLKGTPRKHVSVTTDSTELLIGTNFIQNFFDYWKANGTLNFLFAFPEKALDSEGRQALSNYQEGNIKFIHSLSFLRHKTERAFFFSYFRETTNNRYCFLDFTSCGCHMTQQCLLMKRYPPFHSF